MLALPWTLEPADLVASLARFGVVVGVVDPSFPNFPDCSSTRQQRTPLLGAERDCVRVSRRVESSIETLAIPAPQTRPSGTLAHVQCLAGGPCNGCTLELPTICSCPSLRTTPHELRPTPGWPDIVGFGEPMARTRISAQHHIPPSTVIVSMSESACSWELCFCATP